MWPQFGKMLQETNEEMGNTGLFVVINLLGLCCKCREEGNIQALDLVGGERIELSLFIIELEFEPIGNEGKQLQELALA